MTKPLFFKNKENNYYLFGFLFQPRVKNANNRKGVIFCDSIGSEKYFSHRVLVNFARLLQANGYVAFLFDYYGNGDSEGDFESTRLESYLSDTKEAIEFLTQETKVEEVYLLGLRLGAVFASLVAAKEIGVEGLVLWSPVIDVGEYLYDSLRSNLTIQGIVHKRIKFNRAQLIEQIKNNTPVVVEGYVMVKDFYQSLFDINLKTIRLRPESRVLLVEISNKVDSEKNGALDLIFKDNNQCLRVVIQDDPFWILKGTNQRYITSSRLLFEKTLSWLG